MARRGSLSAAHKAAISRGLKNFWGSKGASRKASAGSKSARATPQPVTGTKVQSAAITKNLARLDATRSTRRSPVVGDTAQARRVSQAPANNPISKKAAAGTKATKGKASKTPVGGQRIQMLGGGTISREEAARIMFGTSGASRRRRRT